MMEIIERKGIGHPDTIADNLSEELANELKKTYRKQYKKVMHYNVDKTMVCAGGQGKRVAIVFAGQYTELPKGVNGINAILHRVVKKVLAFEISKGMKYSIYDFLNPGSVDLVDNYKHKKCNDTSFAVGHPLTKNEKLVLAIGKHVDELHKFSPFIGRDNKVMFVNGTVYIALAFIEGDYSYFVMKESVRQSISKKFKIPVIINNADTPQTQFITKIGTSMEAGDSGATGRGNRRNGLITPMKPMTMEAYYGKNDQTHIGRIYQDKAMKLAKKHNKRILLVNKIGGDIKKPIMVKW